MNGQPKVLLVDPDHGPDNLFALEAQLGPLGAHCLKAGSRGEALALLSQHEVAAAVVAVQLPEGDGFELAKLIRTAPRTSAVPLVFVAAGPPDPSTVYRGYQAGAVDFLVRPFEPQLLASKIGAFLQLHQQNSALAERVQQLESAERARHETERRFRSLADNITQLAWMARPDGHLFWYNRRWYEYTGTTPEQMEGWGWKSVHDPEVLPEVMQRWTSAIAAGREFEMDFPLRGADGTFRRFLTRAFPLKGDDGQVREWFGTNTDVTSLVETQLALHESEHRFRSLAEALPELVFEMDALGRPGYLNEQWARYTGCRPQDLKDPSARWDPVHPDDRELMRERWAEAVRIGDVYECEYRLRRHDGAYRWFLSRAVPRRDGEGRIIGWSGAAIDIQDLKRVHSDLQKLSRLYAVLSKANEAIVRAKDAPHLYREVCRVIAEDGGRPLVWIGLVEGRTVRPVAWHGRSSGYLEGLRIELDGPYGQGPGGTAVRENRAVVNDDFASESKVAPWRERALRYHISASAVFPLRLDGVPFGELALYGSEPGTFDSDEVRLFEALAANISFAVEKMRQQAALRESERSLREADKLKNEFMAILSHELRNPLAPIKNSLYILDRVSPGSEQATRAKETIGRQVDHLTNLVSDLLDVTRIANSKVRLQHESLELNDIVRRSADDNRSLFEQRDVELLVEVSKDPIVVFGDRTRLAQVISNLLQNAAKFTPAEGRASISVKNDGGTAIVRVADNGVGMAETTLRRLFQPFAQAAQSIDRSGGGLGLGLALVKGLVELHGGRVTARSDGLGAGSEFILELPCESQASVQVGPKSAEAVRERRRILLIEDNRDAADSLREVLEIEGHEVAVAHDGAQGLRLAREREPEVVFCDIGLPGMDGYEVARALRADERLRSVHLVALTGYALPEDVSRATEAGFDDHVAKPPSIERLVEILSRICSSRPARVGQRERSR